MNTQFQSLLFEAQQKKKFLNKSRHSKINQNSRLFESQRDIDSVDISLLESYAILKFFDEKLFSEFLKTYNDNKNHKQPLSLLTYYIEFLYDKCLKKDRFNFNTGDLAANDIDVLDSIQYVLSRVLVGRNFEKFGIVEIL